MVNETRALWLLGLDLQKMKLVYGLEIKTKYFNK